MTARVLVLAAGILVAFAHPSLATEDYPVRGSFLWRAGWKHWPAVQPSTQIAPWYLWWPANATESFTTQDFQTSPYPTWPAANPWSGAVPHSYGPAVAAPQPYPRQAIPAQPVGLPRLTPPSYPYGR